VDNDEPLPDAGVVEIPRIKHKGSPSCHLYPLSWPYRFVRLVTLEEGQQPTDLSPEELGNKLALS
jgi:hypothetical protein